MIQKVGNNSMIFEKPPVILAASSVVGEKEGQGPLGQYLTMWRKIRSLAWRHGSRQRVPCS